MVLDSGISVSHLGAWTNQMKMVLDSGISVSHLGAWTNQISSTKIESVK